MPRFFSLLLLIAGLADSAAAGDRFQLFVTGVAIDPGTLAYVFTAVKIDNVEALAWDCSARIPTRRGDGARSSCRRANYQWRLPGNTDVRSFPTYPFVENLQDLRTDAGHVAIGQRRRRPADLRQQSL